MLNLRNIALKKVMFCIVATYLSQKEAIQWKVLVNIEWHMFLMEIILTENWGGGEIHYESVKMLVHH